MDTHSAVRAQYLIVGIVRPRNLAIIPPMTIRVLVVDDHPVVRAGLCALLNGEDDMRVIAEAADGFQAVARHAEHDPDVTLMDLRMPRSDGMEAIRAIHARKQSARIVALTTFDGDADIFSALAAGACGYLLKDMGADEIIGAVRTATARRRIMPAAIAARLAEFTPRLDLTSREVEVLHFVGKGLRNKEIARALGRTEGTVKVHLKHIMAKLGVSDRTEAVTRGLRRGIIHL